MQREVQAKVNQDGISGIVSFRQHDPASAVRVSITLRGLVDSAQKVRAGGRSISPPMGVNSISPAHVHVRPMGRTFR